MPASAHRAQVQQVPGTQEGTGQVHRGRWGHLGCPGWTPAIHAFTATVPELAVTPTPPLGPWLQEPGQFLAIPVKAKARGSSVAPGLGGGWGSASGGPVLPCPLGGAVRAALPLWGGGSGQQLGVLSRKGGSTAGLSLLLPRPILP